MFSELNVTSTKGVSSEIIIDRRMDTRVIPEAIFFSVALSGFDTSGPLDGSEYDARLHEIYYFWDFGEEYFYTAPANIYAGNSKHENGHKNARYAYGPKACHIFRTSGTYAVSCLCVEPSSGKFATAAIRITIAEPETMFSGNKTVFLSPSGDFDYAPSGATRVKSGSLDSAISNYCTGQEMTPKRILLNRGERYTYNGNVVGSWTGGSPSFVVGAGGRAGAKPSIAWNDFIRWSDATSLQPRNSKSNVWYDLDIQGPFDDTTDTTTVGIPGFMDLYENSPGMILIDNCKINGCAFAVLDTTNSENGHGIVFNDTVVENRAYGVLAGYYDYFAAIGCRFQSRPNAIANATDHQGWNLRLSGKDSVTVIHSCDFFGRQGWSGLANIIDIAYQGHIRFNYYSDSGCIAVITANSLEGGYNQMGFGNSEGLPSVTVNALIDKNYVLGCFQNPASIDIRHSGITVRNNIFVMPNVAGHEDAPNLEAWLDCNGENTVSRALDDPIKVYNNTFVNLDKSAHSIAKVLRNANTHFSNVTVENNIEHQPGPVGGSIIYAPLGDDTNLFTPRETGYLTSTKNYQSSTYTLTSDGQTDFYDPEAGSLAIGSNGGALAYDDFRGMIRSSVLSNLSRSSISRGAWEPDLES